MATRNHTPEQKARDNYPDRGGGYRVTQGLKVGKM